MPKYAEIIYEPGSKSVVSYDDADELKSALLEQHRRAKAGENGGPSGHSAERVTRVILYGRHPADYKVGGNVDVETLKNLIDGMSTDEGVSADQLISALRDETSPVYPTDQGKHESIYKMSGSEMDLAFLEGDGS